MSAILGVSGLSEAVRFKREHWPGLDEREYRISQGFDAAAALVVDGVVVAAAAEERFNRRKQSGDFPVQAIDYCLQQAGLSIADVDEIAHCFDYAPFGEIFSLDATSSKLYDEVFSKQALVTQVNRHFPDFSGAHSSGQPSFEPRRQRLLHLGLGRVPRRRARRDGRNAERLDLSRRRRKAGEAPRNLSQRLARHSLFARDLSSRLRLQLRRIQNHGTRAIRRPAAVRRRFSSRCSNAARTVLLAFQFFA